MKMNGDANQIDTEAHNRQKASINRCSGKQILIYLYHVAFTVYQNAD